MPLSFIFMAPAGVACTCPGYAGRELAAGGGDGIRMALLAPVLPAIIVFASHLHVRRRNGTP